MVWKIGDKFINWGGVEVAPCLPIHLATTPRDLLGKQNVYSDGRFVTWYQPSGFGTPHVAWSDDGGITWTDVVIGTLSPMPHLITYGNGIFVSGESNFRTIQSSTDGITWTTRLTVASPGTPVGGIEWNGSQFVAVYNNPSLGQPDLAWSSDGITWNQVNLSPAIGTIARYTSSSNETNGYFYTVGINTSFDFNYHFWYSTNGATWTTVSPPPTSELTGGSTFHALYVGDTHVFFSGRSTSGATKLWSAPLGTSTWTEHTVPDSTYFSTALVYDGIRYWMIQRSTPSTDSFLSFSNDLVTWHTIHTYRVSAYDHSIATNGIRMMILADDPIFVNDEEINIAKLDCFIYTPEI